MSLVDILLTVIIQSLFCSGLRVLLSDGQIFHFIREPFEYERDSKMNNYYRNKLRKHVLVSQENIVTMRKDYAKYSSRMSFVLKPLILCVVCFASIWGGLVGVLLNGYKLEIIICCISTAFILKFINDKVEF